MSEQISYEYFLKETRDSEGRLVRQEFFDMELDVHFRIGGPSVIEYDVVSGRVARECWTEDRTGVLDRRDGGPAQKTYDVRTGVCRFERYFVEGAQHREGDLPADITRDPESGHVVAEVYYHRGVVKRLNGRPTISEFKPETGELIAAYQHPDTDLAP